MNVTRVLLGGLLVCAVTLGGTGKARAAFLFCNQTKVLLEAAFGHHDDEGWVSEGWWPIQPGQCARVYSKPLTERFYFYYARAMNGPDSEGKAPMVWAGKYELCIDNKAFRIVGDGACDKRHFRSQGFQEIDIGQKRRDYTLRFQDGSNR